MSSAVTVSLRKVVQVWIILLVSCDAMSDLTSHTLRAKGARSKQNGPFFDDVLFKQVHASVGQTILLPCTVRNLGNKVVSWIRSKDLHILTSGRHAFSGDTRFEPVHTDSAADFWGLRIRGAFVKDTGRYECQVSTEPKMSMALWLDVTVPGSQITDTLDSKWIGEAHIDGSDTVYAHAGSPVTLTCKILPLSPQTSIYFSIASTVRWLRDNKEIGNNFTEDHVSVYTEYSERDQRISSSIHLPSVTWEDSGQYTCMQPSSKPAYIKLLVIEGEHSEAMQRDYPIASSTNRYSESSVWCLSIISFSYLAVV